MDQQFLVTLVRLMYDTATTADWINAINAAAVNSDAWHEGFIEHIFFNAQHLVFKQSQLLQLRHESLVALVTSEHNIPRPNTNFVDACHLSKHQLIRHIHGLNINHDE